MFDDSAVAPHMPELEAIATPDFGLDEVVFTHEADE